MKKEEITKKLESDESDTDYIFRTKAEDDVFLENHKRSVIEEELPKKVNEIHTQYDDDMFELFGIRKKSDQKTYNFLKEQFGKLKKDAERVADLETQLAELKKNKPDDAKLQEIADLQKEIKRLKSTHEEEIQEVARKNIDASTMADLKVARAGLKFKPGIPDDVIDSYMDNIMNGLIKNSEQRDGKTVFLDIDKKALRNTATMAPYTARELLLEKAKNIIDTGHQQAGAGVQSGEGSSSDRPPVSKDKEGKFIFNFTLPEGVTSQQKLGKWLTEEMGIKSTTPEYRAAYKEYSSNLPIVEAKK